MLEGYRTFLILIILFVGWFHIEQMFLKEPLFAMSIHHIKYFRNNLAQNKILEKLASFVSLFGDKLGFGLCL